MKTFDEFINENENSSFTPGYVDSNYETRLPVMTMKKPTTGEEWFEWFDIRANQLRKSRRSMHLEDIITKARNILTGEVSIQPYSDMYTSTAGFQWGKEFLDILANDGLLKVVKKGNKVFAELGVSNEIKKQLYHKYRGTVTGKKFGL
jgi:hypothetical protein